MSLSIFICVIYKAYNSTVKPVDMRSMSLVKKSDCVGTYQQYGENIEDSPIVPGGSIYNELTDANDIKGRKSGATREGLSITNVSSARDIRLSNEVNKKKESIVTTKANTASGVNGNIHEEVLRILQERQQQAQVMDVVPKDDEQLGNIPSNRDVDVIKDKPYSKAALVKQELGTYRVRDRDVPDNIRESFSTGVTARSLTEVDFQKIPNKEEEGNTKMALTPDNKVAVTDKNDSAIVKKIKKEKSSAKSGSNAASKGGSIFDFIN
ncbi:hypothetical protein MIDIC_110087 [Alphaproteobacteria bacterium]